MTMQHGGMAAWYQALADRETVIKELREKRSALRGRLGEYITALGDRDKTIQDSAQATRRDPEAATTRFGKGCCRGRELCSDSRQPARGSHGIGGPKVTRREEVYV